MTTNELSRPDFELLDHALSLFLSPANAKHVTWPDNARARKLREWFHEAHSATITEAEESDK